MKLVFRDYCYDLSEKVLLMGILNVTPDSFSDGGIYFDPYKAADRALEMEEEGADIIDIGGESTRPGSKPISVKEELKRVLPVIERLKGKLKIPISIDTYKAEVAKQAIEAGACIVNDISGLKFDHRMASIVAEHKVAVILMHIKGTPKDMQKNPKYNNLLKEIYDYLKDSIKIATEHGISDDRIIIDPGIGFGKSVEDNLKIIKYLDKFSELGKPILVGPSRKSFIGTILGGLPPLKRIEGTAAAVAISVLKGANIIRVHDIKIMLPVIKVAEAIKKEFISH